MITISRRQARTIRSLFRRALGISSKVNDQPVQLSADHNIGHVRAQRDGIAVEYRFETDKPAKPIVVPISIISDCEAARDDLVTFSRQSDGTLLVEWENKGAPVVRTAKQSEIDDSFPDAPKKMYTASDGFLPALRDAMETTDRDAIRYNTNCAQLCGDTGRILSTDSRQALIISGFDFPWANQILLPWNGVFGLKALHKHETVRIGHSGERLVLATGPWTLHFNLEIEGRFPRIDDCIPSRDSAKTTLTISEADAEFAVKSIRKLPDPEFDHSVTVDLNGTVTIRAQADGPATELVLRNSRRDGKATCFVSDRRLLQHALQLGFREFRLSSPEHLIHSEDGNRTFLWMPLAPPDPVPPGKDTVRLESPVDESATPSSRPNTTRSAPRRRTNTTMSKSRQSQNGQSHTNGQDDNSANGLDGLIEQAEALKTSLRETQSSVNDLISGLKQHRQQTKKLRSAVMTLKQLQAIDA